MENKVYEISQKVKQIHKLESREGGGDKTRAAAQEGQNQIQEL